MSRTLFRDAQLVLPNEVRRGSLLVHHGRIAEVDCGESVSADVVVECGGRYLMPGVIDDQVHFREPGLTHKEDLSHASHACAIGGVTSFLEMPNTKPPAITQQGVRDKEALAAGKSLVNYGFYIGATPDNVEELRAAGDDVPGIKIFIGSSTGNLLVDEQAALETIFAETTLPICAHCEDETTVRHNAERFSGSSDITNHSRIRDERAAMIATARATDLARRHQHRFHVLHVSTAAELQYLDAAPYVTAEVCLHHLEFNVDDYPRLGSRIQMNPSIKTKTDNEGLWQALLNGTIQVIATDHAPHTLEEKSKPYPESPSGLPAVENSLALMLNRVVGGQCTLPQVAGWMSDAPARVWDIVGKGRIATGYDADLVLVDLEQKKTIRDQEQQTKTRWSPWDGVTLTGWPVATYVAGVPVWTLESGFDHHHRGRKLAFEHARGGFWCTPNGVGPNEQDSGES